METPLHHLQFSFIGIKSTWIYLIIIGLALLAIIFSWLGTKNIASFKKKMLIFSLRVAAIILITLSIFQPQIERQDFVRVKNKVVLIFDNSRSMTLKNSDSNTQRIEVVKQFIKENQGYIKQLEDYFDVDFLSFSDTTKEISDINMDEAWVCNGLTTDINQMLNYLKGHYSKGPVSGFFLFSDGINNVDKAPIGFSESDKIDMLKRSASLVPAPIFTFGPGNPYATKDIAIKQIEYNEYAFTRQEVNINAIVTINGFSNIKLPVALKEGKDIISSRLIEITEGKKEYPLNFTFTPFKEGSFIYTVSIPIQEGEGVEANNKIESPISVLRDRIRVLHICGRPSWDERFLRDILKNDPNIDLISFYIMRTPTDISDASTSEMSLIPFPTEELFTKELDSFDLVIFQNFDYRPFDTSPSSFDIYFNNIKKYVLESGGSFLMIGGDLSFSQGGYNGTAIEDILPVELGIMANPIDFRDFYATLTSQGEAHPITMLDHDKKNNLQIWKGLPVLKGYNKVNKLKPGAINLVSHPQIDLLEGKMPIISVINMGNGRTMAVMTDSLWRWGFISVGKDGTTRHYIKFWKNAVKWLTQAPELNLIQISTDRPNYQLGDNATAKIKVRDIDYKPIGDAEVVITVDNNDDNSNDGPQSSDTKKTDMQGKCSFSFYPDKDGYYKITAKARSGNRLLGENSAIFRVESINREFRDIAIREDILINISKASGGDYYRLPIEGELEDKIILKDPDVIRPLGVKRYSLWDNWIAYSLIVGTLCGEWWLRKKVS